MASGFDRRHPRSVVIIRTLVVAWLLAATGILLAYGYWIWAVVTAAGAVANAVLGYRAYRTITSHGPNPLYPVTPARSRANPCIKPS